MPKKSIGEEEMNGGIKERNRMVERMEKRNQMDGRK